MRGASLRPRAARGRSRSRMPGALFSALACRKIIKRMVEYLPSISCGREFSMAGGGDYVATTVKSSGGPAPASTWYTGTKVSAPERAPLASDVDVDVCVIGAGLAGLTAAREIARRGYSVVVIEAREIAWNAS